MRLAKNVFIIIIINIIFANPSWAATKAWLFGSEKALKLNVETNAIEREVVDPTPEEIEGFFLDARRGNLFILYTPARFIY